jgi:hypothetical protein
LVLVGVLYLVLYKEHQAQILYLEVLQQLAAEVAVVKALEMGHQAVLVVALAVTELLVRPHLVKETQVVLVAMEILITVAVAVALVRLGLRYRAGHLD